ncbi:unnamed protein product [Rotaria sordida]|uniref:F-box domain-containing protein n=1 Tax=Rotaria sordida TaxID=392033 RepID=A0A815SPZ2_9BILA|nr:unnamed protein product [Rotaria sordida]CAF1651992.1 unnamed protein product [Rotaria sordida]
MIQVKRYLNNSELPHEETKKLRTKYNDRKITNCLENLSNELFYEIFDYLDGCDLFKAFSNLNIRFEALLTSLFLLLKIDLRFHPEVIRRYRSTCIVVPNKHRIISLSLTNFYLYNSTFTRFNIDSSFSRLESLVLDNMKSNELIPLLINLISLPRLFSLTIYYDDDLKDLSNIYQIIFNLPMLNYYKLSFSSLESFIPISRATNDQFSSIKYLVIDHCCTLDELINIISYTPQLCRLTCEEVNESTKNIVKDTLNTIFSLTHIFIAKCYAQFDELETFLTNVSPQLEVLCINTFKDVNYLDANRWEQIISQYLLYLNTFEFQYEEFIDEDFKASVYHELINHFNSSFWIERKWFFTISIKTDSWDDNIIAYSIVSYRQTRDNFEKEKKNNHQFIGEIYENVIQHNVISNKHVSIILNVTDLSHTDSDELFIDMISPILAMIPITCLNITLNEIFIGTLIDLMKCLSNLDSLFISTLSMIQPRCLSIEEIKIFRLLSNTNKITKVNLEKMNDLEEVQFLVDLCPRMKYFEIDCTNGICPEKVLRFILMKNSKYIRNLCVLCLKISPMNMNIIDKLKNIIDIEQLCQTYTIEQIDSRIYFRLNL